MITGIAAPGNQTVGDDVVTTALDKHPPATRALGGGTGPVGDIAEINKLTPGPLGDLPGTLQG